MMHLIDIRDAWSNALS